MKQNELGDLSLLRGYKEWDFFQEGENRDGITGSMVSDG